MGDNIEGVAVVRPACADRARLGMSLTFAVSLERLTYTCVGYRNTRDVAQPIASHCPHCRWIACGRVACCGRFSDRNRRFHVALVPRGYWSRCSMVRNCLDSYGKAR